MLVWDERGIEDQFGEFVSARSYSAVVWCALTGAMVSARFRRLTRSDWALLLQRLWALSQLR